MHGEQCDFLHVNLTSDELNIVQECKEYYCVGCKSDFPDIRFVKLHQIKTYNAISV